MNETGAPIPPEGSEAYTDRAARQEAADAAYARKQAAAEAPTAASEPVAGAEAQATAQAEPVQANVDTQAKAAKPKKESKGLLKPIIAGACSALVVVIIAGLLVAFTPLGNAFRSSSSGTYNITTSDDATVAEAVSAKCLSSVVTIDVYSASSSWSQYFQSDSSSDSETASALGSGVIIKSDSDKSYVLTNYHVLEDCSKATITIDNKTYECTAVGYDDTVDLAVVSIPVGNLTVAEWGDSDELVVGDWVMAIGSPMGYDSSCSTGIVSAAPRDTSVSDGSSTFYNTGYIQTDAAINPGNSGGALVNDEGQVIGIVEWFASYSSASAGIGFAIPSSTAQEVAEELIENGSVDHAILGIEAASTETNENGVEIAAVIKDSAADKAGIEAGDYLTKVGDKSITSYEELKAALTAYNAGDEVSLTWTHDGKEKSKTVELVSSSKLDTSEYSSQEDTSSSDSNSQSNNGYGYGYGYGNSNGDSDSSNGYGYSIEDLMNSMMQGQSSEGTESTNSESNSFWN